MAIRCDFDDLLDLINEDVETKEGDIVIDPVSLALMQRLHYLPKLTVISLTVILYKLDQVAILERPTHPILLL